MALFFYFFDYKQYSRMGKNSCGFFFFFPAMNISAPRQTENLLQALGSDSLSAIKFLFMHTQSLVAKTADIVIYTI